MIEDTHDLNHHRIDIRSHRIEPTAYLEIAPSHVLEHRLPAPNYAILDPFVAILGHRPSIIATP